MRGFTIVELLIVIVVIAILAAIVTIAYNGIQAQARAAVFVSTIDVYEKEARMYQQKQGNFYEATLGTGGKSTTTNPSPSTTVTEMQVCMPGEYPADDTFAQNECFVQSSSYTYVGESSPAAESKVIYNVSSDLKQEIDSSHIVLRLPPVPLDNGYKWSYSIEMDLTQEQAESLGIPNPHAGRVVVKAVEAFRGIFMAGCDMSSPNCVYIIYNLAGDQPCGRGTKTVQNNGELLANMAAQLPDFIYANSSQLVTKCTLVMR